MKIPEAPSPMTEPPEAAERSFVRLPRIRRVKLLPAAALLVAGIAAVAATCTVQNTRMTTIGGKDTFAGAIVNNTGADFLGTNVDVSFLDSANEVVETQRVEPALRSFPAGATNFFSATASADPSETTSALASLATDSTLVAGIPVSADYTLSNIAATRDGTTLHVTGTLTSNDPNVLAEPHVALVVRDDAGNIVIVAKDTSISDLTDGQSASFALDVTVPDDSTAFSVDVWADALDGGVPTSPISVGGIVVTQPTATPTATDTPMASATATPAG